MGVPLIARHMRMINTVNASRSLPPPHRHPCLIQGHIRAGGCTDPPEGLPVRTAFFFYLFESIRLCRSGRDYGPEGQFI
jgi:hypothetical protein